MGFRQRRCDGPCRKKRRFEEGAHGSHRKWELQGWSDHGVDHSGRSLKWCPFCTKAVSSDCKSTC